MSHLHALEKGLARDKKLVLFFDKLEHSYFMQKNKLIEKFSDPVNIEKA